MLLKLDKKIKQKTPNKGWAFKRTFLALLQLQFIAVDTLRLLNVENAGFLIHILGIWGQTQELDQVNHNQHFHKMLVLL